MGMNERERTGRKELKGKEGRGNEFNEGAGSKGREDVTCSSIEWCRESGVVEGRFS